jgi:peptidoglycan hydrolase-like protein with peptidoglycan-binding domain
MARMKLQPARVTEIQRRLIDEGYLQQEPTGKWDNSTRDAMLRYQTDHGFAATGLPEAKALMKLGLGPHPLPAEVDPSITAQARATNASDQAEDPEDDASDDAGSETSPQ